MPLSGKVKSIGSFMPKLSSFHPKTPSPLGDWVAGLPTKLKDGEEIKIFLTWWVRGIIKKKCLFIS
jgi:hypothetical protein